MSNGGSNGGPRRRRGGRGRQPHAREGRSDSASPSTERSSPSAAETGPEDPGRAEKGGGSGKASLRGPAALERLKSLVATTTHQLERLREENAALAARIAALEGEGDPETPLPRFEEDPEMLRQKVDSFIEAIDAYLDRDASSPDAPTDGS